MYPGHHITLAMVLERMEMLGQVLRGDIQEVKENVCVLRMRLNEFEKTVSRESRGPVRMIEQKITLIDRRLDALHASTLLP